MESRVIRAAMALKNIPVSLIAQRAGVSKSAVYKTIQGIRKSSKVLKVVDHLLGNEIRALRGGIDEVDDRRRVV